jgi:uncharacterized protein (UPF0332 family)
VSGPADRSPADEMALAKTCLHDARAVLDASPRIAAREAYLAMLHAAHARIAAASRKVPGTHKGVSIVIGELYRTSDFRAQAMLAEVEAWKLAADYGRSAAASRGEAEAAIDQAERFVHRMSADIGPDLLVQRIDRATLTALRHMRDASET